MRLDFQGEVTHKVLWEVQGVCVCVHKPKCEAALYAPTDCSQKTDCAFMWYLPVTQNIHIHIKNQ